MIAPAIFDEAFAQEARALGIDLRGRDVLAVLTGALRPEMVAVLRACKARLKTGCITNNFVSGTAWSAALAEVLALFDHVIESSKVGVRKPDPAIYRLMCDALGIRPEEAVFLDDLGVNLKPARALGMTTIKVEEPALAIAELEKAVGFALR